MLTLIHHRIICRRSNQFPAEALLIWINARSASGGAARPVILFDFHAYGRCWRVEAAVPRGIVELAKVVFANARSSVDNAFRILPATRTLAAVLAEVKP